MTSSREPISSGEPSDSESVILVDADDRPLGTMEKLDAHRRGLRHRAFSVFVCDDAGRFLLQQRALSKYHSGGLWTNTCCSHPRPNEPVEVAARRRIAEEMGFSCELVHLFLIGYTAPVSGGLIENEVVHVFGGRFDGTPRPDPNEVMAWTWREPEEIGRNIQAHPEHYTVWFAIYWRRFWQAFAPR
jgi:isopentenyl-diphosphate delta-isomerase